MSAGAVGWIADLRDEPPAWLLATVSATVEDRPCTQWRVSVFGVAATRADAARRAWKCLGECGGGRMEMVVFDDLDAEL